MQVVYNDSFQSMVKACILKEVKGYEPVREAGIDSFVKADDFDLNSLFIEWDWVHGTPHNVSGLDGAVRLALRHKFSSQELLFSVIKEALINGVDFVLTRKSFDSKRFCNQVFSVRTELRNAKLGIRFTRDGDLLFGKFLFSHNISDLLLDFYSKRFPEKKVVISNNERAFSLNGPVVLSVPAQAGQFPSVPVLLPPSINLTSFM